MSDDEGPSLIRPVARRPFTFICQSPSPSDHELSTPQAGSGGNGSGSRSSSSSSRTSMATTAASSLGLNLHHNLGLGATLAAWDKSAGGVSSNASEQASPAISRPASFMNLTSSTLYGIYAPTVNTTDATQRELIQDSPWDMGAQTPIRRPDMDDECRNLEMMSKQFHVKTRHLNRRRSSLKGYGEIFHPYPAMSNVQLALRIMVLFVLGLGYGALVTRLHDGNMSSGYGSHPQDDLMGAPPPPPPGELNLKHLTAWGVAGVVLGSLLPWFDGIWEARFGPADEQEGNCSLGAAAAAAAAVTGTDIAPGKLMVDVGLDWVLVVRAIGAFVGIAFAIRKLAWSSTMQIAATLALVNPLLWWLIDRSKAGFVLSAAVGLVGSALLLGISPDMMPTPAAVVGNLTTETTTTASLAAARGGADMRLEELRTLVGHHNAKTLETGVWMLSVLFCSCLCFGNIGRRLFLSRAAKGSGRWGGVR